MWKRRRRRENFSPLNAWLDTLWNKRPALVWLLTIEIVLVILGLAEFLRHLVTWAVR
jgi:hypothetical protein